MTLRVFIQFRLPEKDARNSLPKTLLFLSPHISPASWKPREFSKCSAPVSNNQMNEILSWAKSSRVKKNGRTICEGVGIEEQFEINDCDGAWLEFSMHQSQSDSAKVLNRKGCYELSFNCESCGYYEYTQKDNIEISLEESETSTQYIERINDIIFTDTNEVLIRNHFLTVVKKHGVKTRNVKGCKDYSQIIIEGRVPLNLDKSPVKNSELCKECKSHDSCSRKSLLSGPDLPQDKDETEVSIVNNKQLLTIIDSKEAYPIAVDIVGKNVENERTLPRNARRLSAPCFFFMKTALARDLLSAGATGMTVRPLLQPVTRAD